MDEQRLLAELAKEADTKILLLVIDGVSGIPVNGATELEVASTPNLDNLVKEGICGILDPILPGITPGSGPAHLALFGYEPTNYVFGRGLLSALGVNFPLEEEDVCARANFATKRDGIIVDRRAGRISTEECKRLCSIVNEKMIKDTKIFVVPEKEHRAVVVLRGGALSDAVTDSDPQVEGKPPLHIKALKEDATYTADVANRFLQEVDEALSEMHPANTMLLRGFSKNINIPKFPQVYKLRACAICTYPMYKGLARLLGMEVIECGSSLHAQIEALKDVWNEYDFFYFHVKETDMAGEDKAFERKVQILEEVDGYLPDILALGAEVVAVTADHSTPSAMGVHSWHPVPLLLYSGVCGSDDVQRFTEKECAKGGIGRMSAKYLMGLLLANAGRLKKFGA